VAGRIEVAFAIETLRRAPLFAQVDDRALEACAASLSVRRYRRAETIFHQGDPGHALFIIESGAVKIVLPSPEGGEGAIIATLARGDFFGELALLDGAPHSATAVAMEPTQALALARDRFEELVDTEAGLRQALFAGMATELRRLTAHVEELHFLDLPSRLAKRLVRLAREADPNAAGEVRLAWPYTQSDLAAMIGGSRQTVNRLLTDLSARGLVHFEKDVAIIPSLERLERDAER